MALKNDLIVRKLLWVILAVSLPLGMMYLFSLERAAFEYNKVEEITPPAQTPSALSEPSPEEARISADDAELETLPEPPQSAFVKRYQAIDCPQNCLSALLKSGINPVLIAQLTPLNQRLSALNNTRLELLYVDYVHRGEVQPNNSKVVAIISPAWQFFAKEHQGKLLFYDKKGNAPEVAMDRIPLRYERISSPFDLKRVHPITRRVRPHEGVDFAAPIGREVWSAGDGVVLFAGSQTGYGKIVIIQHEHGYETRYAHLHRYFVREGERVKRRQKIGLVGNTGFSTGPHLHYEVRIFGTPHDPLKVRLPSQFPLPSKEMKDWVFRAEQHLATLAELKSAP